MCADSQRFLVRVVDWQHHLCDSTCTHTHTKHGHGNSKTVANPFTGKKHVNQLQQKGILRFPPPLTTPHESRNDDDNVDDRGHTHAPGTNATS